MHLTYLLCASVCNSHRNAAEMLLLSLASCCCVRCCVSSVNCSVMALMLLCNVAKQATAENQRKGKVVGVAGLPVQERGVVSHTGAASNMRECFGQGAGCIEDFLVMQSDQTLHISVGEADLPHWGFCSMYSLLNRICWGHGGVTGEIA